MRGAAALLPALIAAVLVSAAATPVGAQGIGGVHRITRLADGVYVATPRFGSANAVIIETERFVVLVDPHSTSGGARALLEEVAALTDRPVRYVVNSHWHGDHHGGNHALAEELGDQVTFISHPATREEIATSSTQELRAFGPGRVRYAEAARAYLDGGVRPDGTPLRGAERAQIERYIGEVRAYAMVSDTLDYPLPALTVDGELTLHGGDRTVVVRYAGAPAHTRGDLVVWLPEDEILVSGDLLTVPYVVPRSGYPASYASVLRDLARYDFRWIVAGHGGPALADDSLLLMMADFLDETVRYASDAIQSGQDREQALAAAASDPALRAFEARIDWDAPNGLRFLNFEALVSMTVGRALEAANSD